MHSAGTNRGTKGGLSISEFSPRFGSTRLTAAATRGALALAVLSVLLLIAAHPAQAQTERVLYNFTGGSDGSGPIAPLTPDGRGKFFGTTSCGGADYQCYGSGTVFELSRKGNGLKETVLYTFSGGADGGSPASSVVLDSVGNLYGTAQYAGVHGGGVVFKLSPVGDSWTETTVYSFCSQSDCADGAYPSGELIMDPAGNLYGTTGGGVFELSLSGDSWTEQSIYRTFNGFGYPGLTMDAAGNIFEVGLMTAVELSRNGNGGWNSTVLHTFTPHTFCGSDITCPPIPDGAPVLDKAGNLYGTTLEGGPIGCGKVYQAGLRKSGEWTENVLYAFSGTNGDGCNPFGGIVFDADGNIYGTTDSGGAYGYGTIFELVAPVDKRNHRYTEKILWSFDGTGGSSPNGALIWDRSGNLYSTTYYGGSSGDGVVFELTP